MTATASVYYSGGVVEWSKAAVLKTAEVQASVGSNPTSSAIFLRATFFFKLLFFLPKKLCDFPHKSADLKIEH
jgi:hypothetical protein